MHIGNATPGAFRPLPRYLYTDELVLAEDGVLHVARKAKKTQLDRAFSLSVRHCHRNISIGNAARWLVKAFGFQLDKICTMAIRYMITHSHRIRNGAPEALDLLAERPQLLVEFTKGLM